ncbi:MAG: hypothetical protein MUE82_07245 [Chloroflexi bacterium]|jgi:hypothetical protein|nr:hypothetical protein [Chloroflexota bacterium]
MSVRSIAACLLTIALVAGCGATATPAPGSPVAAATGAPTVAPTTPAQVTPAPTPAAPLLEPVVDAPTVIDVPTTVVSETTVTPAGAEIAAEGVSLVVPAGGVAAETPIVIARLGEPFGMNVFAPAGSTDPSALAIGKSYDFGPSGTTFDRPAIVTLPYDPANVPPGTDPSRITAAYWTGTHWAVAGGTVDPTSHTVTVGMASFPGAVLTTIILATAAGILINQGIKWYYGADGVKSDAISEKNAPKWITPDDPSVRTQAGSANVGGIPLSDPTKVADHLKQNADKKPVPVTLTDPDGAPTTLVGKYSQAPGKGWQKPGDYLTKGGMSGDCTDVTNAIVSIFRAAGYPAKGVFGYVVDKESPHAWAEVLIGGKPYIVDEEGKIQPLDQAMADLKLIRPGPDDPRAFMWDETGQAPYTAEWWNEEIDANGSWAGTFTITDIQMDEAMRAQAEKAAEGEGCDLTDALKQLVGKAIPMTMDISVDKSGKGSAIVFIDYSVIKDAKGKPLSSKPSEENVTYVGNRLTLVPSGSGSGGMSGSASRSGNVLTIRGTTSVAESGLTLTGVWSVSRTE